MKYPPYARDLVKARQAGELVSLCIVGSGWDAGKYFEDDAEVARVVVLDDMCLDAVRWNFLAGLDVLVAPGEDTPDARYHALILAAFEHQANSLWAEFEGGVFRCFCAHGRCFAQQGPVPLSLLARAVRYWRTHQLLGRIGAYADDCWDGERDDIVRQVETAVEAKRALRMAA